MSMKTMKMIALVKEVRNDIREKILLIIYNKYYLENVPSENLCIQQGGEKNNIILCLHVKRNLNETKTF